MPNDPKEEFRRTVDEAVDEFARTGFSNAERLAYWQERIRRAAEAASGPRASMDEMLRDLLKRTYERMISSGKIARYHPGIARFTIDRVRPELRAALERRIIANADLIRLKKKQRVEETLARFSGWATSQPSGGSAEPEKVDAKRAIKKPIYSLPFEERRLHTDQGHKLTSALSEIVANGNGAIAGLWRSNFRQPNYDYREDHKERDGKVYLIPGSWAVEKGYVKAGAAGTVDDITKPAFEPYCRCWYIYLYSLRQLEKLAPEMITAKGRAAMEAAREKARA